MQLAFLREVVLLVIHPLVQHANDQDIRLLVQVENGLVALPLATQARPDIVAFAFQNGRLPQAGEAGFKFIDVDRTLTVAMLPACVLGDAVQV